MKKQTKKKLLVSLLFVVLAAAPFLMPSTRSLFVGDGSASISQLKSLLTAQVPSTCVIFNQNLSLGDGEGDNLAGEVKKMQEYLRAKSYYTLTPTGFFGKITKNAVMNLQANNIKGYPPTGNWGPETRAWVNSQCQKRSITFTSPVPGILVSQGGTSVVKFTTTGYAGDTAQRPMYLVNAKTNNKVAFRGANGVLNIAYYPIRLNQPISSNFVLDPKIPMGSYRWVICDTSSSLFPETAWDKTTTGPITNCPVRYESAVFNLIAPVTPPTATTVSVSLVGTPTATSNNNDGSDNDTGTFVIKYRVTANGGNAYVSANPAASYITNPLTYTAINNATGGVIYYVYDSGGWATTTGSVAVIGRTNVVGDVSPASNMTNGWLIEKGESADFTLTMTHTNIATNPLDNGLFRAVLKGFGWSAADDNILENVIILDPGIYNTPYVTLD